MVANLLQYLNRIVDRLFGFELTAEELRHLDDLPHVLGNTSSQDRPDPASPQPVPRPAAH